MQKHYFLFIFLVTYFSLSSHAQINYGSEIISYQKFGEGLMVTRAKMVPISGVVSNFFFYNREDQPWNGNIWYEYDWEMRGRLPENGWSQIRVRSENGGQLKDAPVNVSTSVNVGYTLYNYILIRKGNQVVYDIRENFDINTYDYSNSSAHGGNSVSLIIGGPRVYTTGGNVADIPTSKQLDYSLGVTAFDNNWAGSLPDGSYTGDMVIDYTRFYGFSGNNLNTTPQWQDEFNGNSLDYSKWQVANWTFSVTQFTGNNIRFENGKLILKVNRDVNSGGNPSTQNLALNGTATQSTTNHNGQASRAIDGNTNGDWSSNSVTHTKNRINSWWEVELANNSKIDQIVLYNRTSCCSNRLSNFSVSVLDEGGSIVWTKYYSEIPSPSLTINLDASGKSVRVNLDGILSLAEVKVFGSSLTDQGVTNLALNGEASQLSLIHI